MSSGYCTMHKSHVLDEAECYFCKEQKPCNNWLDVEPEPKEYEYPKNILRIIRIGTTSSHYDEFASEELEQLKFERYN